MTTTTALLVTLLLAAPAKAPKAGKTTPPPAAKAEEGDDVKKAKELFQRAQALYKQARYQEAIEKFEEAYAVRPHPVIYFNIGKCYEQLNETPKALRAYRDYLRLMPDAKDRDNVTDAIANLERRLKERGVQQLMVFADPPNAHIAVDGKELGTSPASVELTAGNHTLTVKAEGFETVERSFVMNTSRSTEMTINLRPAVKEPPPPPPPVVVVDAPKKEEPKVAALTPPPKDTPVLTQPEPAKKKGRVWTWVAGGVAVASAGAAVGMGLAANGASAELRGSEHSQAEAQALHDKAQGMATGANVAWGVAAAAAVTAAVLFFVE
ncbi:MAG: PEGA domain-containing protein [Myxococcota bacterium]